MLSDGLSFKDTVQAFWQAFRPVSLREEQCHKIQRSDAGGNESKAKSSSFQRALSVIHAVKQNFNARGGRSLDVAVPKVVNKFAKAKQAQRFPRPNQKGNAMFSYIAFHSKGLNPSTRKELSEKWKGMSAVGKSVWRSMHSNAQRVKKQQMNAEAVWKRSNEETSSASSSLSTSWSLGDGDFPLTATSMKSFLDQFTGKRQGLATLSQYTQPEVEAYVNAVHSGKVQYHFREAAKLACDAYFGGAITVDDIKSCSLTEEIMSTPVPSMGCYLLHPGLCACKHSQKKSADASVIKLLPKKSCVLQFKSRKFVLYARSVLGLACMGQTVQHFFQAFFSEAFYDSDSYIIYPCINYMKYYDSTKCFNF